MKYKDYGTNGWQFCTTATEGISGACKAFAMFRNFHRTTQKDGATLISVEFANWTTSQHDAMLEVFY